MILSILLSKKNKTKQKKLLNWFLFRNCGSPEKGFWGGLVGWLVGRKFDLLLFRLLGEKDGLDVGQDTTLGDGDSREKFVQLLVITDGELKMSWDDSGLLVVTGSIASQLEDLSSEVLEDGSQVDRGTSTHPLSIVAFAEESVDSANGELKSSAAGSALCLSLGLSSFSTSRHFEV